MDSLFQINMTMDNSQKLLYTWFGNTHKFDYVHRLVISFYMFKVLATPNEGTTGKALDILWDCIMNQTFKPKMRGIYLVTDEIRNTQLLFAKEYDLVLDEISRMYPELLIHIERENVVATMTKEQMEKSTKRFIVHLNQFMISMKVAYKHLSEPESITQSDNPSWILTMLKVFKGKYNERLWFDFVMNEMKSLPDDKRNEEMDLINIDLAGSDKANGENVREHEMHVIIQEEVKEGDDDDDDDNDDDDDKKKVGEEAEEEEEKEKREDNEEEDAGEEEDDADDGEDDDADHGEDNDDEEHTCSCPEKENFCIQKYPMSNKKRKSGGKLINMKQSKRKVVALKDASNESNESSTTGYHTDCSYEEDEIESNEDGVLKSENCTWIFKKLQYTLCGLCDKDGKLGIGDMRFVLKMMEREEVQQIVIRK